MSLASERVSWVDRWWPALVIGFGLVFVSVLVSFKPGKLRADRRRRSVVRGSLCGGRWNCIRIGYRVNQPVG